MSIKGKDTQPSRLALCTMLARRNHRAGVLLYSIKYWAKYGKALIPDDEDPWIANKASWWSRETALSPRQFDRAIAQLAKWNLIERRQWWFAGLNILHVRPTSTAINFIDMSTTWEAAHETLQAIFDTSQRASKSPIAKASTANSATENKPETQSPGPPNTTHKEASFGNLGSSDSEIPDFTTSGNVSFPKAEISNNIINSHDTQHSTLTGASPASPACTGAPVASGKSGTNMKNVKDIDDKKKAQSLKESQALISNANEIAEPGIIQKLLDLWEDCVIKHYDDNDCAALLPLTGKQVGTLNLIVKQLKANWASGHDHSAQWPDVIAWVLSNWDEFEKKCPKWAELPGLPEVEFLDAHLDVAVKIWLTAGQPVYKPKDPKPASGKPPTRPWIEH